MAKHITKGVTSSGVVYEDVKYDYVLHLQYYNPHYEHTVSFDVTFQAYSVACAQRLVYAFIRTVCDPDLICECYIHLPKGKKTWEVL